MNRDVLFQPVDLGALRLRNRIVMPAMMRMRATDGIPHAATAEYYAQRAAAGLIIAEATAVSEDAPGYPGMTGLYTAAHVEGWRRVVDAVHDEGGLIVLQLVHHGRLVHSSAVPNGKRPVGPSAVRAGGLAITEGFVRRPFEVPRALTTLEVGSMVATFWRAARMAIDAGFDGVEINAANGSLLDQFLHDDANTRTDAYGGSGPNRARLLFEVVDAISDAVGPDMTAVRLSPFGRLGALRDSDPVGLYRTVFDGLSGRNLAYLNLIEPTLATEEVDLFTEQVRAAYTGRIVSAGGHTPESAAHAIGDGIADAVAFGRLFVANPDLPLRLQLDLPLNEAEDATLFGGGEHGLTDYPSVARRYPPQKPASGATEVSSGLTAGLCRR